MITFKDENDKTALRESGEEAKQFYPFSLEGTDAYSMQQIFESACHINPEHRKKISEIVEFYTTFISS